MVSSNGKVTTNAIITTNAIAPIISHGLVKLIPPPNPLFLLLCLSTNSFLEKPSLRIIWVLSEGGRLLTFSLKSTLVTLVFFDAEAGRLLPPEDLRAFSPNILLVPEDSFF